jgi:hypothetical protein
MIRDKVQGTPSEAEELGEKLADMILERGGRKLLELVC